MKTAYSSQPPHLRRRTRFSWITIPERVGPHVRLVFSEMQRRYLRYQDVADGSGIRLAALKAWRRKNRPSLESIEAVLGYLGYDFVPVPREGTLPPEFDRELRALAERAGVDMPTTFRALIEVMATGRASRAAAPKPDNDNAAAGEQPAGNRTGRRAAA